MLKKDKLAEDIAIPCLFDLHFMLIYFLLNILFRQRDSLLRISQVFEFRRA